MTADPPSRTEEIAQIHTEYKNFYRLLGGGTLVTLGVLIGAVLFSGNTPPIEDITGYFTNLYTEAVSVILTIFVLNFLQERREENRRTRDLQEQLVRDAGSSVNATARSAIDELRKRGWLGRNKPDDTESLLKEADLSHADLQGASLSYVNLQGANLWGANLQGARLIEANLQNADLYETNLQGAVLQRANLQGMNLSVAKLEGTILTLADLKGARLSFADLQSAKLEATNLQDADLGGANLQGTNLKLANLQGANLENATFDEKTLLPDNTKWTTDTDMTRFTDAEHPNFWRSDDRISPAYKGDDDKAEE